MNSFPAGGVAVVVGAGGIGRAMVSRLRRSGRFSHVVVGARSADALQFPAADDGTGTVVTVRAVDLVDTASMEALARHVESVGQPTRLVVCASGLLHRQGGPFPERRLEDLTPEALAEVFAVNAFGPALLARYMAPLLPPRERSVYAALSARVGSIGDNRLGGWYGYRASKAALNQLLKCVAIELGRRAPEAIVAALHPGTVDTPLSQPFQAGVPREKLFTPDQAAAKLLAVIDDLSRDQTGGFFAWDGSAIPW